MLAVAGLTKRFFPGTANEVTALDALDLRLPRGDFVTVIGPNGAGKSTLLKVIAGVVAADAGCVALDERDVTRTPEHARARRIGRVDQDALGSTAPSPSRKASSRRAARSPRASGRSPRSPSRHQAARVCSNTASRST